jgi:hypothetical protein
MSPAGRAASGTHSPGGGTLMAPRADPAGDMTQAPIAVSAGPGTV